MGKKKTTSLWLAALSSNSISTEKNWLVRGIDAQSTPNVVKDFPVGLEEYECGQKYLSGLEPHSHRNKKTETKKNY